MTKPDFFFTADFLLPQFILHDTAVPVVALLLRIIHVYIYLLDTLINHPFTNRQRDFHSSKIIAIYVENDQIDFYSVSV